MFSNAGGKIKVLAQVMFWLTFIAGTILCLVLAGETDGITILFIPVAFFVSWLANLGLYAFGELCENVYEINRKTSSNGYNYNAPLGQPEFNNAQHPETATSFISNDTMKCPNCGKPTPAGEKYCLHCGDMLK